MLALVGRELCLYLLVDAARVPARQRAEFVALAVRRAAPFPDPDFDVLWLRDHAAVWYWSRERAHAAAGGGVVRYRAEALYRGEVPVADSEQLLLLDVDGEGSGDRTAGVEARIWRQGRLQASRWWPQLPDARAWATFARGAGLDASQPMPEAQVSVLRDRPLNANRPRLEFGSELGNRLPLVAGVASMLVLALLAWQSAGVARAAWATHSIERQTAELSAPIEKIIAARERADAAQARIDRLLALRTPASQVRMLGEVKRLTPGNWEMAQWTQATPELLEVRFRMPNADVAAIVAAWEASPLFEEVTPTTATRPDEVGLQARLTPLANQTP